MKYDRDESFIRKISISLTSLLGSLHIIVVYMVNDLFFLARVLYYTIHPPIPSSQSNYPCFNVIYFSQPFGPYLVCKKLQAHIDEQPFLDKLRKNLGIRGPKHQLYY